MSYVMRRRRGPISDVAGGVERTGARGSLTGRPKKLSRQQIKIVQKLMDDKETKVREITKALNVSRSTLYRYQTDETIKK